MGDTSTVACSRSFLFLNRLLCEAQLALQAVCASWSRETADLTSIEL